MKIVQNTSHVADIRIKHMVQSDRGTILKCTAHSHSVNMPRGSRSRSKQLMQFCTIKCKLSSILSGGKRSEAAHMLQREVLRAHEMTKLGSFFFKAFCLYEDEIPPVCHSTLVAFLQQVTTRSPSGVKGKSIDLAGRMERYWRQEEIQGDGSRRVQNLQNVQRLHGRTGELPERKATGSPTPGSVAQTVDVFKTDPSGLWTGT